MTTTRFVVFAVSVASVFQLADATGHAQFAGLARRLPDRANTLVLINPETLFKSPLAVKEKWREQHENTFAAGVSVVPPGARQFLMAAQMDFEFMQPLWEVALMSLKYEASLPRLAAERGGQIDNLEGRNAVLMPTDTYVVEFNKQTVGAMRPANRQNVSRWLRQADASGAGPNLSPYLTEAIAYADKGGTPIIMAMDAQNVLSPSLVKSRAETIEALKGQNVDLDKLAEAVASLQGITLGIVVKDRIYGALKVDFDQDISAIKDIAKPLLLEILSNNGAMIDEFESWEAKVSPHQIQLQGALYQSGLRRILSVLNAPPSLQDAAGSGASSSTPPSASTESDEESLKRVSSQQYFKSVGSLVDDLQKRKDIKTMGQVGIWFGRYARKIDELPMLNVDPMLLDYGAYVSDSLRQAETSLRDVGGKKRVRQLNAPAQYDVYGRSGAAYGRWGGYGYYGGSVAVEDWRATAQNRARIATEERVSGAKSARDIMQGIAGATADVRREMTKKYQAEF